MLFEVNYRDRPVELDCPRCRAHVVTELHFENGLLVWIIFLSCVSVLSRINRALTNWYYGGTGGTEGAFEAVTTKGQIKPTVCILALAPQTPYLITYPTSRDSLRSQHGDKRYIAQASVR